MKTETELMEAINASDINKLIEILGLKDFTPNYWCYLSNYLTNLFKEAGLPSDLCNQMEYESEMIMEAGLGTELYQQMKNENDFEPVPCSYIKIKLDDWKAEMEYQTTQMFAEREKVVDRVLSIVEPFRTTKPALMSLENEGEERKLTLVDIWEKISLTPEQIILLMESPDKNEKLSSHSKVNGKVYPQDGFEMFGCLNLNPCQITVHFYYNGTPMSDPNGHMIEPCFDIDIEQLVMYYAIFKREQAERDRFLQLRNKSQPPVITKP
jgi:hypothetical protein